MVALEALIASALALLLAAAVTGLLAAFWQIWSESNRACRQRQWSTVTFGYLDEDLRCADTVRVSANNLRIIQGERECVYQVTESKSLYRGIGNAYYPLAQIESARWWQEGGLLWVELIFPGVSYRCCYSLVGKQ